MAPRERPRRARKAATGVSPSAAKRRTTVSAAPAAVRTGRVGALIRGAAARAGAGLFIGLRACQISRASYFKQERDALAAADAGRGDAQAAARPLQFTRQGVKKALAGRAQGMAQGDGAAVHIHDVAVEAELFFAGQILRREGLVDLDA